MKTEDFDRLKDICEKEGFALSTGGLIPGSSILVEVYKKEPWDGVEFFKTPKVIFKINRIENGIIEYQENGITLHINTRFVHPSTESAYIEQLKKEAFERFGSIKEGDRFKWDSYVNPLPQCNSSLGFIYFKDNDCLSYNGCPIYQVQKGFELGGEELAGSV